MDGDGPSCSVDELCRRVDDMIAQFRSLETWVPPMIEEVAAQ